MAAPALGAARAAGKAAFDAITAGWYFYLMPTKEKAWCAYCITGAVCNFTVLLLSLPEARRASRLLRKNSCIRF
jgi:hypothetical protein